MGIISAVLGLADPVSKITSAITSAQIARYNAQTDQDRVAADEQIKTLSLQRDVLIKSADSRFGAVVRAVIALPFIAYVYKLILYDKLWMDGTTSTDPLGAGLENIMLAVIGYYFLTNLIKVAKR